MNLFEIVQKFGADNNCVAGACDASPLDPVHLQASAFVPFVRKNIEQRTNPAAILPGAQSIIVLGVGADNSDTELPSLGTDTQQTALLSSLATGRDYHVRVKSLLNELVGQLSQHASFSHKILVDSPTLDERAFALRAGIGFLGRNGLIISPMFGSRFNIGLLLTDILIPAPSPYVGNCPPNCRLCIDACPNNALAPSQPLNTARCISYLTQKAVLSAEEETLLGNQLYGCDICQNACPFNTPQTKTYINPQDWLNMDDDAFAKKYAHTAMLWQGAQLLRRNAQIVNKNSRYIAIPILT